jgi:molybdopterin synthase sulfur carrier subunit
LLGPAREAAGVDQVDVEGATVGAVLQSAVRRFGPAFEEVLSVSQVWVNGEPAESNRPVGIRDEVAVLPPISGG